MPVVGQRPRTRSFPCLCWNMAAAEATPPAATGEPGAARRAGQAPGPACVSSGALWRCAAARQAGRRRRWDRTPSVPQTLPAGHHRPSLACGTRPGAAGRAENDSAWWHCGSSNGAALESPASPSALCESKKPRRGPRSHPSSPSGVGSTGVLGELVCLPLGFWWGVRVYLRRTSQALHAPGDPSPRLSGSTSPPSRGTGSLECLYTCSRISLGVFWGPSPALAGHRRIHRWRWHVAPGSGLACPLLLRASLPLFCSGAAGRRRLRLEERAPGGTRPLWRRPQGR